MGNYNVDNKDDYSWLDDLVNAQYLTDFDLEKYRRSKGLSDDNPYLRHIDNAVKKKDIISLQQSAIEWEANQQAYAQQMEDSSPLANLLRQRQAGLNPDIATGSGGSTGSSLGTGAPQAPGLSQADTNLNDFYDVDDTLNIINTVASSVSAFTNSVGAGLNFAQGVAQFGSALSSARSAASIAADAADISSATKDAQIRDVQNQSRISGSAANVAESTEGAAIQMAQDSAEVQHATKDNQIGLSNISYFLARFGKVAEIAKYLVPNKDGVVDNDSVLTAAKNFGLTPEETGLLQQFVDTPQYQQYYNDAVLDSRRSRYEREEATDAWLKSRVQLQYMTALVADESNYITANFINSVKLLTEGTQNYIDNAADNVWTSQSLDTSNLAYSKQLVSFNSKQLQRDFSAFQNNMAQLDNHIEAIDALLSRLKDDDTMASTALRESLIIEKNKLRSLSSKNLFQAHSIVGQAFRKFYSLPAMSTNGDIHLFGHILGGAGLTYTDILFNNNTHYTDGLSGFVNQLLKYYIGESESSNK